MNWRSRLGAGLLVLAMVLAAGCSGGGDASTPAPTPPPLTATPAPLTATPSATPAAATATPAPPVTATATPAVTATTAATPAATVAPAPAAPRAQAVSTAIVNFAFEPSVTVAVGSTVTWTNSDGAPHTVSATDGTFDSGTLNPGDVFSHTFATAGTFAYLCHIHPFMTGTVVVQ